MAPRGRRRTGGALDFRRRSRCDNRRCPSDRHGLAQRRVSEGGGRCGKHAGLACTSASSVVCSPRIRLRRTNRDDSAYLINVRYGPNRRCGQTAPLSRRAQARGMTHQPPAIANCHISSSSASRSPTSRHAVACSPCSARNRASDNASWVVDQNLFFRRSRREHFQNVFDADSHARESILHPVGLEFTPPFR